MIAERAWQKEQEQPREGEAQLEGLGEDQAGLREVTHGSGMTGGEGSEKGPGGPVATQELFQGYTQRKPDKVK